MRYSLLLLALLGATNVFASTNTVTTKATTTVDTPADTKVTVVCSTEKCKKVNEMENQIHSLQAQLGAVTQTAQKQQQVLEKNKKMVVSVIGQGVSPMNTSSPAQAYALAKRAAVADAYRLIAEKVKGVYVDGQDVIKNMMVQRSTVRTSVDAMVRNANVVETTFKEGLCEVEMEIVLTHSQFAR